LARKETKALINTLIDATDEAPVSCGGLQPLFNGGSYRRRGRSQLYLVFEEREADFSEAIATRSLAIIAEMIWYISPMNKVVSLTWILWALRSFR